MNEQDEKQPLNTWLDREQVIEFDMIQRYYAIASRSDVVRMLIRQEARRIGGTNPLLATQDLDTIGVPS